MRRHGSNARYKAIREAEAILQEKLKKADKEGNLKEYMKTDEYWRENLLLECYKNCLR